MRFVTPMIIAGFLATACSTQPKDSGNAAAPVVTTTTEQSVAADQMPAAAIVRVELDASGNPVGAPDMRTTSVSKEQLTGTAVAAAFESGAAPQKVRGSADELDSDTSVQSWGWGRSYNNYGYNSYNNYGGYNNYSYGYNNYNSNYGYGNGYNTYYGGNSYGYGYNSYYSSGNYGYYSYCR